MPVVKVPTRPDHVDCRIFDHFVPSQGEEERAQRVPLLDSFLTREGCLPLAIKLGVGPVAGNDPGQELGRMLADSHQDFLSTDGIESVAEVDLQDRPWAI